jgi:hypothetical protein
MLPKNVSPAAERRRSLLIDAVLGILIAVCAIVAAAGIGVVAFFALIVALILSLWYLVETALHSARRRRKR